MHNISATLLNAISSPGIRVMQSVVHRNQLFKDSALDYTYADEDWLQGFPRIWVQHAKVLCTTLSLDMIVAYETAFCSSQARAVSSQSTCWEKKSYPNQNKMEKIIKI